MHLTGRSMIFMFTARGTASPVSSMFESVERVFALFLVKMPVRHSSMHEGVCSV